MASPRKKIANDEMTADWELAFDNIEKGKLNKTQCINDIQKYTAKITSELLSLHIPQESIPLNCPKCQQHYLIIKNKVVKCRMSSAAGFSLRKTCGTQLSINDLTLVLP